MFLVCHVVTLTKQEACAGESVDSLVVLQTLLRSFCTLDLKILHTRLIKANFASALKLSEHASVYWPNLVSETAVCEC